MTPVTTKRIAILVARNNFVYRGVGAYVKSIIEWAVSEGFIIDVISDDAPRENGMFDAYKETVNWFKPDTTLNDSIYKELSAFSKPFDVTLSINFRNAFLNAIKKHTYDLIITNVGEALHAIVSLGVHKYCTVLHPTHHESEAGVKVRHDIFSPGVCDQYQALCGLPNVKLACQSNWVCAQASALYVNKLSDILVCPPLLTEPELLNFNDIPKTKWGVGFIGPWEPRKNPEAYIAALKKSKLPGIVLVPSEASAKKFKDKFEESGIEYKIHVGVTGKEKTAIIKTFAAAYHPAISETFGLGALETAHSCPTFLLSKNEWSQAHAVYCTIASEEEIPELLIKHYGEGMSVDTQNLLVIRNNAAKASLRALTNRDKTPVKTTNNFYKKLNESKLIHHEEFVKSLPSLCTDEVYKMLKIPSAETVEILHSKNDTYYRIVGCLMKPPEKNTNLFDFY